MNRETLSSDEFDRLVAACRALPPGSSPDLETDFLTNVLLTVLDFQMRTVVVERALGHFNTERRADIRSLDDLVVLLDSFPNSPDGNRALAQHLWGYSLWTRAGFLRELVRYFITRDPPVTTQERLVAWATASTFEGDFARQVKGLGLAVYSSLAMRLGVETIKPDVHVLRFASTVVGRLISPSLAITSLTSVARELGLRAYELDWRIWEYQRRLG